MAPDDFDQIDADIEPLGGFAADVAEIPAVFAVERVGKLVAGLSFGRLDELDP